MPKATKPEKSYQRVAKADSVNLRLDFFLSKQPEIPSRSYAQRLITEGQVFVNKKKPSKHHRLKEGDRILFKIPLPREAALIPESAPLNILYEDKDMIVLSKPPQMVVHPVSPHQKGTLVHALLAHAKNFVQMAATDKETSLRPGIVHRLDKNTSGLMIVAKNEPAREFLIREIKKREVKRTYLALVHGSLEADSGTIDIPLGKGYRDRTKITVAGRSSRKAITHFRVKERFEKYTLLEVDLETGRTHQIRVHMSHIKHPVVGDQEYGYRKHKKEIGLERQFLHACRLGFTHPVSGKKLTFADELPDDLQQALMTLRVEKQK